MENNYGNRTQVDTIRNEILQPVAEVDDYGTKPSLSLTRAIRFRYRKLETNYAERYNDFDQSHRNASIQNA